MRVISQTHMILHHHQVMVVVVVVVILRKAISPIQDLKNHLKTGIHYHTTSY